MELTPAIISAEGQASNSAKQLRIIYDQYYEYLLGFLREKNAFHRNISFPLFIKPFPDYFNAATKMMIIGKETFSWGISETCLV